jgi:hypothetical protein
MLHSRNNFNLQQLQLECPRPSGIDVQASKRQSSSMDDMYSPGRRIGGLDMKAKQPTFGHGLKY